MIDVELALHTIRAVFWLLIGALAAEIIHSKFRS